MFNKGKLALLFGYPSSSSSTFFSTVYDEFLKTSFFAAHWVENERSETHYRD